VRDVRCDVCGATSSELFALRPPRTDVLHRRFVRCRECGFVYADPRATAEEAQRFYESISSRGSGSLASSIGSDEWNDAVAVRRRRLEAGAAALDQNRSIRFLDVGFGDGTSLAAAAELGWEPYGLEYAEWLVDAARERLGLENLVCGDVAEAPFEPASFDVVYSWHVVEHVLDLDEWFGAVARILRPGGVLVLGTENADGLQGKIWRAAFKLSRRTPWPPTSTDHTYWFSCASLRTVALRHDLEPAALSAYENSPLEIVRGESLARLRNPRWLASLALYLAASTAALIAPRLGGKILLVARKQPAIV